VLKEYYKKDHKKKVKAHNLIVNKSMHDPKEDKEVNSSNSNIKHVQVSDIEKINSSSAIDNVSQAEQSKKRYNLKLLKIAKAMNIKKFIGLEGDEEEEVSKEISSRNMSRDSSKNNSTRKDMGSPLISTKNLNKLPHKSTKNLKSPIKTKNIKTKKTAPGNVMNTSSREKVPKHNLPHLNSDMKHNSYLPYLKKFTVEDNIINKLKKKFKDTNLLYNDDNELNRLGRVERLPYIGPEVVTHRIESNRTEDIFDNQKLTTEIDQSNSGKVYNISDKNLNPSQILGSMSSIENQKLASKFNRIDLSYGMQNTEINSNNFQLKLNIYLNNINKINAYENKSGHSTSKAKSGTSYSNLIYIENNVLGGSKGRISNKSLEKRIKKKNINKPTGSSYSNSPNKQGSHYIAHTEVKNRMRNEGLHYHNTENKLHRLGSTIEPERLNTEKTAQTALSNNTEIINGNIVKRNIKSTTSMTNNSNSNIRGVTRNKEAIEFIQTENSKTSDAINKLGDSNTVEYSNKINLKNEVIKGSLSRTLDANEQKNAMNLSKRNLNIMEYNISNSIPLPPNMSTSGSRYLQDAGTKFSFENSERKVMKDKSVDKSRQYNLEKVIKETEQSGDFHGKRLTLYKDIDKKVNKKKYLFMLVKGLGKRKRQMMIEKLLN